MRAYQDPWWSSLIRLLQLPWVNAVNTNWIKTLSNLSIYIPHQGSPNSTWSKVNLAWNNYLLDQRMFAKIRLHNFFEISFLNFFPSIRVLSSKSTLHIRWPKYWSFSFSISPSNEYSELISFRIDWFDLLVSKGLSRVFSRTTVQKHQFFHWVLGFFF